jgi:hypothetical protein
MRCHSGIYSYSVFSLRISGVNPTLKPCHVKEIRPVSHPNFTSARSAQFRLFETHLAWLFKIQFPRLLQRAAIHADQKSKCTSATSLPSSKINDSNSDKSSPILP